MGQPDTGEAEKGGAAAYITHADSLLASNEELKLFGTSAKPW